MKHTLLFNEWTVAYLGRLCYTRQSAETLERMKAKLDNIYKEFFNLCQIRTLLRLHLFMLNDWSCPTVRVFTLKISITRLVHTEARIVFVVKSWGCIFGWWTGHDFVHKIEKLEFHSNSILLWKIIIIISLKLGLVLVAQMAAELFAYDNRWPWSSHYVAFFFTMGHSRLLFLFCIFVTISKWSS